MSASERLSGQLMPATPGRTAHRSLVPLSLLTTVVAVVLFMIDFVHPYLPLVLLWVSVPVALAIAGYCCWRTGRTPWLSAPIRRFWRHLSAGALVLGLATIGQAYDTLGGPTVSAQMSPATLGAYSVSTVVVIWAMYRLPIGSNVPGAALRLCLDAGTVVLAAGVFMWHFQTRPLLAQSGDAPAIVFACSAAMVLALVAVFAIAKVILSGSAVVDNGSLRLLALGVMVGSLGSIPQTYMQDRPWLQCQQITVPIVAVFVVMAAQRQRRRSAGEKADVRVRRPYSVLPYVAVVAIDGLLLGTAWAAGDPDHGLVATGAVALTALVVLRQLTAFQDNGRLLARLNHSATHDALTQLPNRTVFNERLQTALHVDELLQTALHAVNPVKKVYVALIDLDDFKVVNDTLGHAVGDALLVAIAPRLLANVRSQDTVARLGGDEFVIVFDGIDPGAAVRAAESLLDAITAPVVVHGHELVVNASIGLADGTGGDDPSELLRHADIAMYAAKKVEGSSCVRFMPELAEEASEATLLRAELHQAMRSDQRYLSSS